MRRSHRIDGGPAGEPRPEGPQAPGLGAKPAVPGGRGNRGMVVISRKNS